MLRFAIKLAGKAWRGAGVARFNADIKACGTDLAKAEAESQSLKDQAQLTEDRLVRAEKLTSGLADEAVRWKSTAESLGDQRELLVGDVFVSAACISYFGAFNGADCPKGLPALLLLFCDDPNGVWA